MQLHYFIILLLIFRYINIFKIINDRVYHFNTVISFVEK